MWIFFLITAAPAYYLVVNSFFKQPAQGWIALLRPYAFGIMWGVFGLTVTSTNLFALSFSPDLTRLLLWYWTTGPGWPVFLISLFASLRHWNSVSTWTRSRQIIAWFCGAGTIFMLWNGFTYDKFLEKYWIFLHPFVWIACASWCAFLLDMSIQRDGFEKILFMLLAHLATFFFGFIIILYLHVSVYIAFALGLTAALGGTLLIYLQARGKVNF